jgi:pimeloyl-ACP methyl ester carboxylesterase
MRKIEPGLYPFVGRFLDLSGVRMHYLDEGAGEPVVAVHGNPTWSFYYRGLVHALRDSYRVVAPDHIGCGMSDKPGDDSYRYTLERRVEDFSALMDHLALDGVTLVAHDWGGAIGLTWAVRNPTRVRRLVILNTAAFHMPASKRLPWQLWLVRDTPFGGLLVRGLNAFARGATRDACTRTRLPQAVRDAYCAPYDSWANRIAILRFVQDIPLSAHDPAYRVISEVEQGLARLADRPVLICWGARDFVFDDHFLAEWHKIFPMAEVHRLADAGHWVLEDASDEILDLVRGFLSRDDEGVSQSPPVK